MTGREVTYTAEQWTLSDGSKLLLDVTVKAHVSDIQVTLIDAYRTDTTERVQYWRRTALISWVGCHQETLRVALNRNLERELADGGTAQ